MSRGTANFGITGVDWQQRINWDRLRNYRIERARQKMKEHGIGACSSCMTRMSVMLQAL